MTPVSANGTRNPAVLALLAMFTALPTIDPVGEELNTGGVLLPNRNSSLLPTLAELFATLPSIITSIRPVLTGVNATPNPAITPLVLVIAPGLVGVDATVIVAGVIDAHVGVIAVNRQYVPLSC
jgi:hypothetical protein